MKQATAIIALSLIGFAIALAAFIGSRLSEQAIALLAGTFCGVGAALPIGVVIGWYIKSHRASDHASAPAQPMVILAPPQPPQTASMLNQAWHTVYPASLNAPQAAPRKYTIGGEEIVNHESDAVW